VNPPWPPPQATDEEDDDSVPDNDGDQHEPEETRTEDESPELPFPRAERDLWELRHARRRGGESSYRQQRWRQFYPIWIDPARRKVIRAGESLQLPEQPHFEPQDGLAPLWPIDAEGHHRCWRLVPASMQNLINEGRVVLGRYNPDRNTWTVNLWVRKAQERRPRTVWWDTKHDAGTHGTSLLNKVLGRRDAFPFPKSVYAVRDCLAAAVRDRPDALILDFFAGSGTTLHATALLNAADDGRRQCILVTNNEVADRQAAALRAAGHRSGSEEWEREGICRAVTVPRCRAVLTGKREDGTPLEGEWFTGRLMRKQLPRVIRALSFADPVRLTEPKVRRNLATMLGIVQNHLAEADDWYIASENTRDPTRGQVVLFKLRALDGFLDALARGGAHIRLIHLATAEDRAFVHARHRLLEALPPFIDTTEETRPALAGFTADLAYLRLDYLDPDALELGGRFADLLPTLWVMAGAIGPLPTATGEEEHLFPEGSRAEATKTSLVEDPQPRSEILVTRDSVRI
jgi:adenine-specific DNA-methyltransferase